MKYEGIVYRPPSEAYSLILQVTIGCAHNGCTFCTMYKDKAFRIRSMEEIRADIEDAYLCYGDRVGRIFLADGDAVTIDTAMLTDILRLLKKTFPSAERITSYGAPRDILKKSEQELELLKKEGLDMIYMGLESGDAEVLKNIRKGVSANEIIAACQKIKASGIKSSITLISGLGGRERLKEHALESAKAVSEMKPDYLGVLTLLLEPGAPLLNDLQSGRFELLKPHEVLDEMELFLSNVDAEGTVFRANHASNYVILKGTLNQDRERLLQQVREVRREDAFRAEDWRSL